MDGESLSGGETLNAVGLSWKDIYPDIDHSGSWYPNPVQQRALACPLRELLYGGAAGGGKSIWLLMDFLSTAMQYPGCNGILFRITEDDLTYLVDTSRDMFKTADPGATFTETDRTWRLSNGSKLRFAHLKNFADVRKYIGQEYQWMGFDELTLWGDRRCYLFLIKTRLRAKNDFMPVFARSTTNPGGPGSGWVYERFIEPAVLGWTVLLNQRKQMRMFIPAKLKDNPHMPDSYREALEDLDEVQRAQLLDGDWNVHLGMAFRGWKSNLHIYEPFPIPRQWFRFYAIDYGYLAPSCVLAVASDPDNRLWIYDELYESRLDGDQLARAIFAREKERGDRITRGCIDPSTVNVVAGHRSVRQCLIAAGLRLKLGNHDRPQGFIEMQRRINKIDAGPNGLLLPSIQWSAACRKTIRVIPSLVYEEQGRHAGRDIKEGGDDHGYDASRYAVMYRPLTERVAGEDPEGPDEDFLDESERRWQSADEFTGY